MILANVRLHVHCSSILGQCMGDKKWMTVWLCYCNGSDTRKEHMRTRGYNHKQCSLGTVELSSKVCSHSLVMLVTSTVVLVAPRWMAHVRWLKLRRHRILCVTVRPDGAGVVSCAEQVALGRQVERTREASSTFQVNIQLLLCNSHASYTMYFRTSHFITFYNRASIILFM